MRRVKLDRPNTHDDKIRRAVEDVLTKNEIKVLSYRLPWTLEETGKEMGLTRERVRAIEAKLFDKILEKLPAFKPHEELDPESNGE